MSVFGRGSVAADALRIRLQRSILPKATTIATAEELLRGWLAQTAKARDRPTIIEAYAHLHDAIDDLRNWRLFLFDDASVTVFERLRADLPGVGTMDLKIASIVIANDATLLSRNLRDFERVPNLKVEDWLQ